ncbi:hypothetical protein ACIPJS_13490 [Streptomyces sp. NPDC086783]|uniref:hypothetical protein n=1 Tax=Streptomyces sp. NPDC086783 TaxID=3365758 RepID=UPI00380BDCA7
MTATTLGSPTPRRTAARLPLSRLLIRQLRVPLALLLLPVLGMCLQLAHHYEGWADAVALRDHVGSQAYHLGRYADDAHHKTAELLADNTSIVFRPALYAAALTGLLTGREWDSRRITLALTQSVTPRRWFTTRWATLAILFTVLTLPLVVLYQRSAAHAYRLDLLVHGVDQQTAYFTIGPVTLAYVVLGVAAGAFTGTWLRRSWLAVVAAPALTWLLTALLVRSRAVLLVDFPLLSQVHGFHSGGLLGLQFNDLLAQDTYLVNSLSSGDYWGYQIASSLLVLALAVLLVHGALRILRRRLA